MPASSISRVGRRRIMPAADPRALRWRGVCESAGVAEYVSTYRWLDLHGRPRSVDLLIDDPDTRRICAYAPPEDRGPDDQGTDDRSPDDQGAEPVLVAVLDADGKFLRLASAASYGLDTAAAWNNLFDLCRAAQGHQGAY